MINTLFSMHNIKYIISVDVCFFSQKKVDMKAIIYSKMCHSLDPFRTFLPSYHENNLVAEIDEMQNNGIDCSVLISSLLDDLNDENLLKCYEACEKMELHTLKNAIVFFPFLKV